MFSSFRFHWFVYVSEIDETEITPLIIQLIEKYYFAAAPKRISIIVAGSETSGLNFYSYLFASPPPSPLDHQLPIKNFAFPSNPINKVFLFLSRRDP